MKRTNIPNPHAPGALAVTDGTTCIGHIVHDGAYFAFGVDNILIGEYTTQREAMLALPAANTVGIDELKSRHIKTTSTMFDEILRGYCDAQQKILATRRGGIAPDDSGKL
jgi:hypothetical protein